MTPTQRIVCLLVLWGAFAAATVSMLSDLRLADGTMIPLALVLNACALMGTWLIVRARHLVPQDC